METRQIMHKLSKPVDWCYLCA